MIHANQEVDQAKRENTFSEEEVEEMEKDLARFYDNQNPVTKKGTDNDQAK